MFNVSTKPTLVSIDVIAVACDVFTVSIAATLVSIEVLVANVPAKVSNESIEVSCAAFVTDAVEATVEIAANADDVATPAKTVSIESIEADRAVFYVSTKPILVLIEPSAEV